MYRQASFFQATMKDLNDLPDGTVTASTPDTLYQVCHKQDSKYKIFFFLGGVWGLGGGGRMGGLILSKVAE